MDVTHRYRSNSNSSDDESEDSDKESYSWKRAVKRKHVDETFENNPVQERDTELGPNTKRRRNNIWSDILQDQLISDDLNSCLLKNKPVDFHDRGEESYDYTLKYTDPRLKKSSDIEMSEGEGLELDNKSVSSCDSFKSNKYVQLDSTEKEAVQKINRVLNEKKVYLIRRMVKYLGINKAMALLRMTEDIEENGGMMIANHNRRRTPGGVYIQLIKSDKDIPKETVDKIFEGEMNVQQMKQHFRELKKRKRLKKKSFIKKSLSAPNLENNVKEIEHASSVIAPEESTENADVMLEINQSLSPVSVVHKTPDSDLEEGEIDD